MSRLKNSRLKAFYEPPENQTEKGPLTGRVHHALSCLSSELGADVITRTPFRSPKGAR